MGSGLALALGSGGVRPAHAAVVRADPFRLGVASGDPLPHGVTLWTRLVRHPLDAHSMPPRPVQVGWEISTNRRFSGPGRRGVAWAVPALAHSVHVDLSGLQPSTDYWYRFRVGRYLSATGHTRTAPAAGSSVGHLRLGVVNCQDWQNGYWPAYDGLAREDLDLVVHLGDYTYEYDPASAYPDRMHNPPRTPGLDQLVTLADFRNRHALYKTDPALQAAHAAFPWVLTWDDHDVENNYANLSDDDRPGRRRQSPVRFARERARAYQAYYEHLPIRMPYRRGSSSYRIFRRLDFGDLVRLHVLDTRQYRTVQPGNFHPNAGPEEVGLLNFSGTLTGAAQEAWLDASLRSSAAIWDVVAQQLMLSRMRFETVPGTTTFLANLDQWDGYGPARTRFLQFLDSAGVVNPVVLGGDIHSSWFSDLKVDFDDPAGRVVASEFVATSISSAFPLELDGPLKAANGTLNPHVRHFDGSRRGYLRVDVDRQRFQVEQRSVASIATRRSPVTTTAAYVTEAGRPGVVPA